MKKKYVSYWNQTLQLSHKLSFYHSIKNNCSHFGYLDSTSIILRKTLRKTQNKIATTYVLKQVGTTKSPSVKGYVPSVVVIKLRTKPISY